MMVTCRTIYKFSFYSLLIINICDGQFCFPRGPCRDGYMDMTDGHYEYWLCGSECEGGMYFTNAVCNCACVIEMTCSDMPTWSPTTPTLSPTPVTLSPTSQTPSPTLSTTDPTESPSEVPTNYPSTLPTLIPTINPTKIPTINPSGIPSKFPSSLPSNTPTTIPTENPSIFPSISPSVTTFPPSQNPTGQPTKNHNLEAEVMYQTTEETPMDTGMMLMYMLPWIFLMTLAGTVLCIMTSFCYTLYRLIRKRRNISKNTTNDNRSVQISVKAMMAIDKLNNKHKNKNGPHSPQSGKNSNRLPPNLEMNGTNSNSLHPLKPQHLSLVPSNSVNLAICGNYSNESNLNDSNDDNLNEFKEEIKSSALNMKSLDVDIIDINIQNDTIGVGVDVNVEPKLAQMSSVDVDAIDVAGRVKSVDVDRIDVNVQNKAHIVTAGRDNGGDNDDIKGDDATPQDDEGSDESDNDPSSHPSDEFMIEGKNDRPDSPHTRMISKALPQNDNTTNTRDMDV